MRNPANPSPELVNTDCMLMCGITYFTGCGWIYAMIKRSEIRERYGIEGSGTSDCCTTYWCPCCALIQHDNEVKARIASGPIAQGYQTQPPMGVVVPPQQYHEPQQQYTQ